MYYYHNDKLGKPLKMTDEAGNVVWSTNYSTFGKAHINMEVVTSNLRFPGQYFDQETGLHYNYFRDYDPKVGRYIESDPLGITKDKNLFVYVSSNPVMFQDELGLWLNPWWIDLIQFDLYYWRLESESDNTEIFIKDLHPKNEPRPKCDECMDGMTHSTITYKFVEPSMRYPEEIKKQEPTGNGYTKTTINRKYVERTFHSELCHNGKWYVEPSSSFVFIYSERTRVKVWMRTYDYGVKVPEA